MTQETGMMIDWETVDNITKTNLKSQYDYLLTELEEHEADPESKWMHPEDYHNSKVNLIPAFKTILGYYGVTV